MTYRPQLYFSINKLSFNELKNLIENAGLEMKVEEQIDHKFFLDEKSTEDFYGKISDGNETVSFTYRSQLGKPDFSINHLEFKDEIYNFSIFNKISSMLVYIEESPPKTDISEKILLTIGITLFILLSGFSIYGMIKFFEK